MIESHETSPLLNITIDTQKRPLSVWTRKKISYDPPQVNSSVGRRTWYHDYTTIDWLHDIIKDKIRLNSLSQSGFTERKFDASQAWIVLTLVGVLTGLTASFIYFSIDWLTDLRFGYCRDDWILSKSACCSSVICPEWSEWSFRGDRWISTLMDAFTATMLALIASVFVTLAAYNSESTTYYYSAGSGVPQVKTILGGFVIRGCLGLRTLLAKTVSLILAVASGLVIGEQGPIVHIACCIGNVVSRIFLKYNTNDGKRREILSAASAAGVSVAFGAPIGGVLFSLEEVSYYFPSKTMWRSFYCALIAAVTLKFTSPYKPLILFETSITSNWNTFDIPFFVLIGILGGWFGAFFIASTKNILKFDNSQNLIFNYARVIIVASLTAILSSTSSLSQISNAELITSLFSDCTPKSSSTFCAIRDDKIQVLFFTWMIKAFLMIITFGIHLPGGIFIPSMVIGALGGQLIAILAQKVAMAFMITIHIDPAIYAMVGAAATISGVTRMTVSLIIIMFEITGSLKYVVPLMISIMVSKWTSDAIEKDSIYDMCIRLQEYPYLDHKKTQLINVSLLEVMETCIPVIQSDKEYTFSDMERKLADLKFRFPSGDGGFPILKDNHFQGYISQTDLEHALYTHKQDSLSLIFNTCQAHHSSIDLTCWMDQSPLIVSSICSMELVLELFIKLGIKTLMIVDHGKFVGLVHKKQLLGFLNSWV